MATKVWNPGATPKPSSWTKGGSDWLWIWTLTPASNVVSSGRRSGEVSGLWWVGWCPPAWGCLSLHGKLYLVKPCCSKAGDMQLDLGIKEGNPAAASTPGTQPKSPPGPRASPGSWSSRCCPPQGFVLPVTQRRTISPARSVLPSYRKREVTSTF